MKLTAFPRFLAITILVHCAMADRAAAQSDAVPVDVVISVSDQKMVVLREGGWVKKYKVSTSRFGLGDAFGSYKTPLGRLRVWEKVGGALPSGAVLKGRQATGEILGANAPGRDPIVSRILWLEGLEAQNDHARGRGIYIHGTTEEAQLGKPVSWGCIRMRSEDVIELYDTLPLGALVTITEGELPHFAKWKPGPPVMIAAQTASVEPSRSVAELWKSSVARMSRGDAGAANAFRGSILFSGLPTATNPAANPAKHAPKTTAGANTPLPGEAFALVTEPLSENEISIRVTTAVPPLALLDLRRVLLSPLLLSVSILDAPIPAFAYADEIDGETTMSAVSRPARTRLH